MIYYANPGLPQLLQSSFPCYIKNDAKYTSTGYAFVPQDYKTWNQIYALEKQTSKIIVCFDMYTNLMNEKWNGMSGFIRIVTTSGELDLAINDKYQLCLTTGNVILYRREANINTLNRYVLYLDIGAKKDTIALYIDGQCIYTNEKKAVVYFDKNSKIQKVECKNIIFVQNHDNARYGIALSNIILSDMMLPDDISCSFVSDINVSGWTKQDDEYIGQNNEVLEVNIGNVENNNIYAIVMGAASVYGENKLQLLINDKTLYATNIDENPKNVFHSMMLAPNNDFWNPDNIKQHYKFKAVSE